MKSIVDNDISVCKDDECYFLFKIEPEYVSKADSNYYIKQAPYWAE